jgi:hypothetical protein
MDDDDDDSWGPWKGSDSSTDRRCYTGPPLTGFGLPVDELASDDRLCVTPDITESMTSEDDTQQHSQAVQTAKPPSPSSIPPWRSNRYDKYKVEADQPEPDPVSVQPTTRVHQNRSEPDHAQPTTPPGPPPMMGRPPGMPAMMPWSAANRGPPGPVQSLWHRPTQPSFPPPAHRLTDSPCET